MIARKPDSISSWPFIRSQCFPTCETEAMLPLYPPVPLWQSSKPVPCIVPGRSSFGFPSLLSLLWALP